MARDSQIFRHCIGVCGLTPQAAADYLDVREDTLKNWSSGRRPVPEGVFHQLGELYARIQQEIENEERARLLSALPGEATYDMYFRITDTYGKPDYFGNAVAALAVLRNLADMATEREEDASTDS